MAGHIQTKELELLVEAISQLSTGAKMSDLLVLPGLGLERKTLQRRLALLQEQGRILVKGRGRATRYHVIASIIEQALVSTQIDDDGIPISMEGQEIRDYVRLPLIQRRPVGYNRTFLDAYRPNQTFYLPQSTRSELSALGRPFNGHILPAGTYARHILDRLLIDLSWNSSRLEGNTYTLLETQRLLAYGQESEGKSFLEAQMIFNHKDAIQFLVEAAEQITFNRRTILSLHSLLSNNLLPDPRASGNLRIRSVYIGGSVYLPLEIPQLIEEYFVQILNTAEAINDPFEQAFFVMVHLPYLQPFEDVNKRVSRLSANIPLIRHNLCPLSFVGVPDRAYIEGVLGVYELNRVELLRDIFVWAYKRSCENYLAVRQSLGEPDPFRLRYRNEMIEVIGEVVRGKLPRIEIPAFLNRWSAKRIPEIDRLHFVSVIETELLALHEGNFVRFRLQPAEFDGWYAGFK